MSRSPPAVPLWLEQLGRPTGKGVRVGFISSGYDTDQPDPRVLPGISFVDPSDDLAMLRTGDYHDRIGLGTTCARLIWRVAPDARVVPIRIYGESLETSTGTLQSALLWAYEQTLDVVCLTAFITKEDSIRPLYATCEKGRRLGTILVCGGRPGEEVYPGSFEPVIGVVRGLSRSPFDFRYDVGSMYELEAWAEWENIGRMGALVSAHDRAAAIAAGIVAVLRERHPGAPIERIRALLHEYGGDNPYPVEATVMKNTTEQSHARFANRDRGNTLRRWSR